MRRNFTFLMVTIIILTGLGCAGRNYPPNLSRKERDRYYREFNESKTPEEWEQIRSERRLSDSLNRAGIHFNNDRGETVSSISFSVKNNSLFPKRLKIENNIFEFEPLEKRYFGFRSNTGVYLLKNGEEEYLFTITEDDEGMEFKIAN